MRASSIRTSRRLAPTLAAALVLPALTGSPAVAGVVCPMGDERHFDPCRPSYWTGQADEFRSWVDPLAANAVEQVDELQVMVASLQEQVDEDLSLLTDFLDAQRAEAEAYADALVTNTDRFVEAFSQNTAELVAAAVRAAVTNACTPTQ